MLPPFLTNDSHTNVFKIKKYSHQLMNVTTEFKYKTFNDLF